MEANKTKPETGYFSHKPSSYYYAFDTSKGELENLNNRYVDTFSIAGARFQLFSNPDTLGDLELQVMKNRKWQTNLKLHYGINGNEASSDFNQDGFNDFVSSLLRGNVVYLFDSIKREFHPEPVSFAFDWAVIDSSRKLYSNNYSSHDLYETDLFQLTNFQQTFYYTAPIEYHIRDSTETATLKLYKVRNNNLDDTILISIRKFDLLRSDFDYVKFWSGIIKQKGYR